MDIVLNEGNLTMGQVTAMFQNLFIDKNQALINLSDVGEIIENNFGSVLYYSAEDKASNPGLVKAVADFKSRCTQKGASKNTTLILIRANQTLNTGSDREIARDSDFSTHWTVLNLKKNGDKIEVRYADSIGVHQGRDEIPKAIKKVLSDADIDVDANQVDFVSDAQTAANCGYMAVWHALKMHGIDIGESADNFVKIQRNILKMDAGQVDEESEHDDNDDEQNSDTKRRVTTRNLARDADDSSDDEFVEQKIFGVAGDKEKKGYDLEESWARYQEKKARDAAAKKPPQILAAPSEEEKLAFIVHAFGNGICYAKAQNSRYYGSEDVAGLKDLEFLDKDIKANVENLVKEACGYAIKNAAKYVYHNFIDEKQVTEENFIEAALEFFADFEKDVVALLSNVTSNLFDKSVSGSLYQTIMRFRVSEAEDSEARKEFLELVSGIVLRVLKEEQEEQEFIDFMAQTKEIVPADSLQDVKKFAQYVVQYAKDQDAICDSTSKGKKVLKTNITMGNSFDKEFSRAIDSDGLQIRRSFMSPILKEVLQAITPSKSSPFSKDKIQQRVTAQHLDKAKEAINVEAHFVQKVKENFSKYLRANIPARRNFGYGHKFEMRKPADFLQALRATNRSDSRFMRNFRDHPSGGEIANMKYDIQLLQLGVIHKTDEKKIQKSQSKGRFSKTDFVTGNETSYPEISGKINKLKLEYGFSDKDIANFVLYASGHDLSSKDDVEKVFSILRNPDLASEKRSSFLKQIAEITTLLFYIEPLRNPASFLMHEMMLELIVAGKCDWQYFLAGAAKKMPMAAEGAVPEARAVHEKFAAFMPWHYQYHGDSADAKRMIEAEGALFLQWLVYKNIDPIFAPEALVVACSGWYQTQMGEVIYGHDDAGEQKNPLYCALKKWNAEITKVPPKSFKKSDYTLLQTLCTKYQLSERQKAEVSGALCEFLATKADTSISSWKKELINSLVQNKLLNLEATDAEGGSLVSWFVSADINPAAEVAVKSLSKEFLQRKMVDDITVMSIAASYRNEGICRALVAKGVAVDERTKETDFYKANEDIFKCDMTSVKEALSEVEAEMKKQDTKSSAASSRSSLASPSESVAATDSSNLSSQQQSSRSSSSNSSNSSSRSNSSRA